MRGYITALTIFFLLLAFSASPEEVLDVEAQASGDSKQGRDDGTADAEPSQSGSLEDCIGFIYDYEMVSPEIAEVCRKFVPDLPDIPDGGLANNPTLPDWIHVILPASGNI